MKRSGLFFLIAGLTLVYALTVKGAPGNETIHMNEPPMETSMERGRFVQILSLSKYGRFWVDEYKQIILPDAAWFNGHYYPAFPPGVSLVSVPLYLLLRQFGLGQIGSVLTTIIISICVSVLLYKTTRELTGSVSASIFAALTYALASSAFAYTVSLSAHPFSAAITAMFVYVSISSLKQDVSIWSMALASFAYWSNLFIDYPNLVIHAPLYLAIVYLYTRSALQKRDAKNLFRKISACIIPAAILLLLFFVYNEAHYSRPIAFTNTFNLKRLEIAGIDINQLPLSNEMFTLAPYSSRFDLSRVFNGAIILLFSHDRGLFVYSPVFIISIFGFIVLRKNYLSIVWIFACTVILDILIYAAFDDPWGGWGFGSRYMIVAIPIFSVAAGYAYATLRNLRWVRNGALILLAVSIAVNLSGALTTNAIPPSVEAVGNGMKDNFLLSFELLKNGYSSSFAYGVLFRNFMSASDFALWLLACILFGFGYYGIRSEDSYDHSR